MSISNSYRLATPTKALFAFVFVAQFVTTLYSAREIALPLFFDFLYPFASLWLICWWLREDSRRTGVTWPIDLGMFLYIAWIFILPYHLFRTRGLKGFLGIFSFIGILIAAWVAAAIVGILLW